jgi:ribosomal protein L11 methylase PrmA
MGIKKRRIPRIDTDCGHRDYFDDRHKRKMLKLATLAPSDVFYDLGCGDASILILAVKEFNVEKAIGFEASPYRAKIARMRVKKEQLDNRISIVQKDMYKADLIKADVIFHMHNEVEGDMKMLYNQKLRKGSKLIKHDLPLIGYLPDKVDYPFYRMTFPLRKAKSRKQWASVVLGKKNALVSDVWHEIYHYEFTKGYDEQDIGKLKRILSSRLKQ